MSVYKFPKKKRKTPDEIQSMQDDLYRHYRKVVLVVSLIVPALIVCMVVGGCYWLSPGFEMNWYRALVTIVMYAIIAATGLILLLPPKPDEDFGIWLRSRLDKMQ